MAKFAYNNAKNTNTKPTLFDLNCGYYPYVFYKKDCDSCFRSKLAKELSTKLKNLMIICCENLYHAQDFQKHTYNKGIKL